MEVDAGDTVHKYKNVSVAVKEVRTDDPKVDVISISNALIEILVKDPVCGRSDYSDLPGVRRDFRSPWRSFAEFPRRPNARQRTNASITSEERHMRSYLARIRREKLTLQRVAKRERLRVEQRERKRQRNLLYKLQSQASDNRECILLNPGVIISSPSKGSPGKLWKDNHRNEGKYYNNADCDGVSKKLKHDNIIQKPPADFQEKFNGVSDSADRLQTFLDEVVSTTSVHRADERIPNTSGSFKCPTSLSEVLNLSNDKTLAISNFLGESEDNPVTSSQDSTEKSLNHSSFKSSSSNDNQSSVNTSWTVTSTTAPEIVDADSSTPRTLKRKTRNAKRVNYAEMLEDDDFDFDEEQQFIRESKTSGRKIRPVKRTLEKAIVDASMKKSPRKRKTSVLTKSRNISSETNSSLATNTEVDSNKKKQAANFKNVPLTSAVPLEKASNHKANMSSEYKLNELIPNVCSDKMPVDSLPIPTTSVSQHHTLICLNNGPPVTSAHNLHHNGSLPVGHFYLPNSYESNKPANTALTCQSNLIPFNQQLYTTSSCHNIPQNLASVITPSNVHNSTFAAVNNFNLVMKPFSVINPHGPNRYLVSNYSPTQVNTHIHNISPQFPANLQPFPRGPLVCDLNQSVNSLPNFLLESQIPKGTANNKEPISHEMPKHIIKQESASNKEEHITKSTKVSDKTRTDFVLPVKNVQTYKHSGGLRVTDRQKKIISGGSNMATQEKACTSKHFLSGPEKNVNQSGPARHSLSVTDRDNKDKAEVFRKLQNQLNIDTVLSSVHRNLADGRSVTSNNKFHNTVQQSSEATCLLNKKSSNNIPTVEPQKIAIVTDLFSPKVSTQSPSGNTTFLHTTQNSGASVSCTNGQTAVVHDKSIGPPPPLISISELLNLPTKFDSYDKNHVVSSSISYQDNRSNKLYQNQHSAISAGHPTSLATHQASFVPNERALSQSERCAVTSQPSNSSNATTQHLLLSSLHHQNVQSQPHLKHLYMQSGPDQVRFVQQDSGSKKAHLPGMPALLGPLNRSKLAGSGSTVYQKSKIPVPELPHSFQVISTSYQLMPQRNCIPEQIVAPAIMTSQAQLVPTQIRNQINSISKTPGVNKLPSYKPNMKQIRALVQQVRFKNKKYSSMPNQLTQSTPTALHKTCTSDFWRLPLFAQEPTQQMSGKSKDMDLNQAPQTSAGNCFPPHSNQQRVASETVKFSSMCHSENTRNTQLQRATSGMQCPSSVNEDHQILHCMITQNVNDSLCKVPSTPSTSKITMTLPSTSVNVVTKGAHTRTPSGSAVEISKLVVVSSSGTLLAADTKPMKNSLLCGLDLSHKTSQFEQFSLTTHATQSLSSALTIFSSKQNQVTAAISKPRVAYDSPLTSSQVKQELLLPSEQPETDNNEVLQHNIQKNLTFTKVGVTSTFTNLISVPATSIAKGNISEQIQNSPEPILITSSSVTSKPTVNITSSNLTVLGHVKVETHLGHEENADNMLSLPTTASSQAQLLRNVSQINHTAMATHNSSLSAYLRSIVDTTKKLQTGTVFHTDLSRHSSANSHNHSRHTSVDSHNQSRHTNVDSHNQSGHTNVDSHNQSRFTSVDSHNQSRHTNVDSHNQSGHTSVDSHNQSRYTSVDSHNQSGHTSVDSHNQSGHSSVDSHNQSRHTSVDNNKQSRHTSVDSHNQSRHTSVDNHNQSGHTSVDNNQNRQTNVDIRNQSKHTSVDNHNQSRHISVDSHNQRRHTNVAIYNQSKHVSVDSHDSVPADQTLIMSTILPAHVNIKEEIHLHSIAETLTEISLSQPQYSSLNSKDSSSNNTFQTSVTTTSSAFIPGTKSPFTASSSASDNISTAISLPHANDQLSKGVSYHKTTTDSGIMSDAFLTVMKPTVVTESSSSVSQSVIFQGASILTFSQTDLLQTSKETIIDGLLCGQKSSEPANIRADTENVALTDNTTNMELPKNPFSTSYYSLEMNLDKKPLCPFIETSTSEMTVTVEMPTVILNKKQEKIILSKDITHESSVNNTDLKLPLQSTDVLNKQTLDFSLKSYSITNDPLFAWCIESPKQVESFSLDDIAGSLSHGEHDACTTNNIAPVNNTYTVTVSIPCSEASSLLPCADASSVDASIVKVEPITQSATLNQKEVIDLCVSDNDEDDPVNIDSISSLLSTSSASLNASNIETQDVPGTVGAVFQVTNADHRPQTHDSHPSSEVMNSDQDVANLLNTSISASPGHPKCVAGQIIKSPLTGRQVVISGEQVNYIRSRLARISGDLSSITANSGSASKLANSVISSVALHDTSLMKETDSLSPDSIKKMLEETVFNKDPLLTKALPSIVESMCASIVEPNPSLIESTCTTFIRSKNQEQSNEICSLEMDPGNSSTVQETNHVIEIKKECIQPICIEDDEEDDDVVFIESISNSEASHSSYNLIKQTSNPSKTLGQTTSDSFSTPATSMTTVTPAGITTLFSPHKDQQLSMSRSSTMSTSHTTGRVLASVANWSDAQVAEWLRYHKLDKICPNLSSLDGRGLQRMAFEHQRDPEMFYTRVKKTLGLTFFQTMVICHSMKELNDNVSDDN